MALGPGKYDAECTDAREATDAAAVVLIVVNGDRGSGVSVQIEGEHLRLRLPAILRSAADAIEDGDE